jgi:hypothetical protein
MVRPRTGRALRKKLGRPSPAMAISLIALVFAMTG